MIPSGTVAPIRGAFRVVTVACVPGATGLDAEGWARAEAIVDQALAPRPAKVRRQLLLFVRLLGLLSFLRTGRGVEAAGPERIRGLLQRLERSPLLLLRRGVWGLRTLAFMGYYGQPGVRGSLGYRAALRGWEDRGEDRRPWPDREGAAPPEAGTLVDADGGHTGDGRGGDGGSAGA